MTLTGKQLFERMREFTLGSMVQWNSRYSTLAVLDIDFRDTPKMGKYAFVSNERHIATKAQSLPWIIIETKAWGGNYYVKVFEPITGCRGWAKDIAFWKVIVRI